MYHVAFKLVNFRIQFKCYNYNSSLDKSATDAIHEIGVKVN